MDQSSVIFAADGESSSLSGPELRLYRAAGLGLLFKFAAGVCAIMAVLIVTRNQDWQTGLAFVAVALLLWIGGGQASFHTIVNMSRRRIEREQTFLGMARRTEVAPFSAVAAVAVEGRGFVNTRTGRQSWSHRVVIVLNEATTIEASDYFGDGFTAVRSAATTLAGRMEVPCLHGGVHDLMRVQRTGSGSVQVLFGPGS
jgi:hypothetical protein